VRNPLSFLLLALLALATLPPSRSPAQRAPLKPERPVAEPTLPARPVRPSIAPKPPVAAARGIRGFADLHTHQFANLGFGGWAIAGEPFGAPATALRWCDRQQQHGAGGKNDILGNMVKVNNLGGGILGLPIDPRVLGHKVGGYPQFDGWPRWDSVSHQAMWEQWLERAHAGGLQLMVMHAVNNEFFCGQAHRMTGRTCADLEAVRLQLAAAKQMEAYLDQKAGGPGKGWYRIVYSPAEARAAIARGQLAVVLGVEVDNAFKCNPAKDCVPQLFQQVAEYQAMGVRHLFPIHFENNLVGGASYDKPLQTERKAVIAGVKIHPLSFKEPYEMDLRDCSAGGYRREGGKCNALGLSQYGEEVILALMANGIIIDVDHMSERAFERTMQLVEQRHYPVVSGHTGFVDLAADDEKAHEGNLTAARLRRIQAAGGMASVIVQQGTLKEIKRWDGAASKVPHTCGNSSQTFAQAYLYAVSTAPGMPIGIGTDMNALLNMIGPRFGSDACPGGKAANHRDGARLAYPLHTLANGAELPQGKAVEGDSKVTRTFDFNVDGLAHVGMLPDLIEDLRAQGVRDQDLEPLMRSAEGYIQVWERALANKPVEGAQCNDLRSHEATIAGQIGIARTELNEIGQAQKDCQAGVGEGNETGSRKPTQCLGADLARKRELTDTVTRLSHDLDAVRSQKGQAGCFY